MLQFIPIAEAGRELRLSYAQAYRLFMIGTLDGERRGSRLFVTRESVDREKANPSATRPARAAAPQ